MADHEAILTRETVIEGVSNDVLAVCTSIVVLLLACLWYFKTQRDISIHPQLQEQVRSAREHLGLSTGDTSSSTQAENSNRPPRVFQRNIERCPICLSQPRFLTITNCGHAFCGNCIISYWRHGHWMGSINCPVCRQQVTILFKNFSTEDRAAEGHDEIVSMVNDYNRRFSGEPRPIMDHIRDIPTLLSQMVNELFSFGGLMLIMRLRIVFWLLIAVLYVISPVDILPEAVFGVLGLLDDILISLVILVYLAEGYRRSVAQRAAATGT